MVTKGVPHTGSDLNYKINKIIDEVFTDYWRLGYIDNYKCRKIVTNDEKTFCPCCLVVKNEDFDDRF